MPSQLHEVLVAMVRENTELAAQMLEWATGRPVPKDFRIRTKDQSYREIKPPEYRADLVVEFVPDGKQGPDLRMVFEVQLQPDRDKKRTWPAYQAVLRAQYDCPTAVVVLAPDAATARWCAAPIDLDGCGTSVMRPLVVGPRRLPVLTDMASAAQRPAVTILSVIAHGMTDHGTAVSVQRATS